MTNTPRIDEGALSTLAYGQPPWTPEEFDVPHTIDPRPGPDQAHPRGNGAVHAGDLARGEEQLGRVLGH